MFSKIFYGNNLESWGISLLIIAGAFVLIKIISFINKRFIQKLTSKTSSRLDDILFKMLEAPVLLGVMLVAIWIASSRLELPIKVDRIIYKSYQILIVLNITWFVSRFVNALIHEYLEPAAEKNQTRLISTSILPLVKRTILSLIWALGIVMALNNVGVDVATLITGLGIGGLAFALAAQDTIKNIFGGITIFTDNPFRIGDRIKVDGFDGFVEDIGIRSTRIRTLEKRLVTIPNYKIVEASVENVSEEPKRRVLMKIGVVYNTSPEKMEMAIRILKNIPQKVKHVDPDELITTFSDFGEHALIITFVYFVLKAGDVMLTPSEVNFEILKQFKEAELEFAYPTQTIYLANGGDRLIG
jgi:MscS family membrane protein